MWGRGRLIEVRWKVTEPFPKVRLNQDRMPVEPFPGRIG